MCAKTERVLQRCVSGIITRVSYSSNICILHNSSHVSYIALLRWKLSWMLCRKWCTLFSFSWLMPCLACLACLPVLAQAGQWRRGAARRRRWRRRRHHKRDEKLWTLPFYSNSNSMLVVSDAFELKLLLIFELSRAKLGRYQVELFLSHR